MTRKLILSAALLCAATPAFAQWGVRPFPVRNVPVRPFVAPIYPVPPIVTGQYSYQSYWGPGYSYGWGVAPVQPIVPIQPVQPLWWGW